ncbi:glycosyltransferase [Candidatus Parcubacteria bacterium]|nr:MAG: glycosyltransferase [Candidatus Parcubacteria bacterium]
MQQPSKSETWYFTPFEHRKPYVPSRPSIWREKTYQVLASASIGLGLWYLTWRWSASINWAAPGFSIGLLAAETLAFIGSVLFLINLWMIRDHAVRRPPRSVADIRPWTGKDRPVIVDVFYPTYTEDEELVRLSLRDAKAMRIPDGIEVRIHVLDDGNRPAMAAVAREEGVNYLARKENIGFKAGNIRHGMQHTEGDLMVIFDADTRPFPEFLERTLGYFRDPDVAWVQTPQWFFDHDEGIPLPDWLHTRLRLGRVGQRIGQVIEKLIGPVNIGKDLLGNDPRLFYDVILRRRNGFNASFCCGAGSIHRREAVMRGAIKQWILDSREKAETLAAHVELASIRGDFHDVVRYEIARRTPLMPYRFHVSEDIYTGMLLHADPDHRWKSIFHPEPLSKMLSPQDLLSWSIQRFKYAGGTLDIFRQSNPIKLRGLDFWQKWMYMATMYSYLAPIWLVWFLASPIIFFYTGTAPVAAYDYAFYAHLLPFLVCNRLALMIGTWGVPTIRGEQYFLAFFWHNIQALWEVLCRQPIRFHVTPKSRQDERHIEIVWPHLTIIALTFGGIIWMGWQLHLGNEEHWSAYVVNVFWSLYNCMALSVMVRAAFKKPEPAYAN